MPKAALRTPPAEALPIHSPAAPQKPRPAPTLQAASLVTHVLHGIREKKGLDISVMSVGKLKNMVTDYFVICSGNTDRQTQAIADSINDEVHKATGERPWHTEGHARGEWILIDYVNVVVHIFVPKSRDYYSLEELWGDAETVRYAE